jgi:hypothetical protein
VKGYGQTVSVGLEANDPDSISHPMKRYAIGSAGSKLFVPDSIILESHAHGPIKIQLPPSLVRSTMQIKYERRRYDASNPGRPSPRIKNLWLGSKNRTAAELPIRPVHNRINDYHDPFILPLSELDGASAPISPHQPQENL